MNSLISCAYSSVSKCIAGSIIYSRFIHPPTNDNIQEEPCFLMLCYDQGEMIFINESDLHFRRRSVNRKQIVHNHNEYTWIST